MTYLFRMTAPVKPSLTLHCCHWLYLHCCHWLYLDLLCHVIGLCTPFLASHWPLCTVFPISLAYLCSDLMNIKYLGASPPDWPWQTPLQPCPALLHPCDAMLCNTQIFTGHPCSHHIFFLQITDFPLLIFINFPTMKNAVCACKIVMFGWKMCNWIHWGAHNAWTATCLSGQASPVSTPVTQCYVIQQVVTTSSYLPLPPTILFLRDPIILCSYQHQLSLCKKLNLCI